MSETVERPQVHTRTVALVCRGGCDALHDRAELQGRPPVASWSALASNVARAVAGPVRVPTALSHVTPDIPRLGKAAVRITFQAKTRPWPPTSPGSVPCSSPAKSASDSSQYNAWHAR